MSTTKTALAAVLVLGSLSLAQAQEFDPNLANRYPAYAEPGVSDPTNVQPFVSRNVALPRQTAPSAAEEAWMDRASQNFGGGY